MDWTWTEGETTWGDVEGGWTREVAVEIEPRGCIRAMKSCVKLTDGH